VNSRQKEIMQIAEREGEVTIKELSVRLNVSEMTIHRDADILQEQRYLFKKRGAVVYVENSDRSDTDFYREEKRRIGIEASKYIKDGASVIFDNSTTALECARFLDGEKRYTFYSTGIECTEILSKYDNSVLYCSGGYYFAASKGFVGAQTEAFVRSVNADVCVIGASGVDVYGGITTPYPMHTSLQKAIISSAKTVILVCDHSKFERRAIEKICDLTVPDIIITDSGISDSVYEKYSSIVKVIKA